MVLAVQRRAAKAQRAVKATATPLRWIVEAPLPNPALAAPTMVGAGELVVGKGV